MAEKNIEAAPYDIICHTPDTTIVAGAKNAKTKSVLFRDESGGE